MRGAMMQPTGHILEWHVAWTPATMAGLCRLPGIAACVIVAAAMEAGDLGAAVGSSYGYVRTTPTDYDASLEIEAAFDRDRSSRECFCGHSRHADLWKRFYNELQTGLAADPSFRGEWVHVLCGVAYPVIFRAVSVDPSDDTFSMHSDCPAGIVSMVVVCAQSGALQHLQSTATPSTPASNGVGISAPPDDSSDTALGAWQSTRRVVIDEGMPVGDVFGLVPLTECLENCERNPGCLSFAHGPHGCHLKSRCVGSDDPIVPEEAQNNGYRSYYRVPCRGGATRPLGEVQAPLSEATQSSERNTHVQELQNMLMFAVRTLEFCFHCLDASPWPFLVAEVLENYALATEAPNDFRWQRIAGRLAGPSTWTGRDYAGIAEDELLPSLDPPTDGPSAGEVIAPVRHVLLRMQVRWTRGLESEADFWRHKLSLDPTENSSLERLHRWLATGEVTWFLDDICIFVSDALARRGLGRGIGHAPPRILNAGSGPFAPRPLECALHWPLTENASVTPKATTVPIVSADGLARFYLRVLDENGFMPPYTPVQCPAEELHMCFPPGHFDVVHMRNALDHTFDPLLGVERMLHIVRPGGWVLLRHARNEGVPGKFRNGLHQWGFDVASKSNATHFVIWNPELRADVTAHLLGMGLAAEVRSELRDHPSDDAPPGERYVWVDIRRPTEEEEADFSKLGVTA